MTRTTHAGLWLALLPMTGAHTAGIIQWLKGQHALIGPIKVAPSTIGGGEGVLLTDDVQRGDALFAIPANLWVTVERACADQDIGPSLKSLAGKGSGGATVALAAYLAKIWLCEGEAHSVFGPYLSTLPWAPAYASTMQQHTLWWTEAQVATLQGTDAYDDVNAIRKEVNRAVSLLRDVLAPPVRTALARRGDLTGALSPEDAIESAVRAAFVAILSRSFQELGDGDSPARLVPLLDLLQHDAEPNVSHQRVWDAESGEEIALCTARNDLPAGTELFNCYGNFPAHVFFSRFGFVPAAPDDEQEDNERPLLEDLLRAG